MSSGGRLLSVPSTRETTLDRWGADSKISGCRPTSLSFSATYSAAARSPGPLPVPSLTLGNRIRSRHRSTTSSSAATAPPSFSGGCTVRRTRSPWRSGPNGRTLGDEDRRSRGADHGPEVPPAARGEEGREDHQAEAGREARGPPGRAPVDHPAA